MVSVKEQNNISANLTRSALEMESRCKNSRHEYRKSSHLECKSRNLGVVTVQQTQFAEYDENGGTNEKSDGPPEKLR